MCLILNSQSGRPKEEYIENAIDSNGDGNGCAFKENGYLRYLKGFDMKEAKKLARELPIGFTMHMRIATVGGPIPELIHPFPVRIDSPLKQEGKANKLLFHNGCYPDWRKALLAHLTPKVKLPDGPFSDTRAIAILTALHGKNFLKLITSGSSWAGKFVLMTPSKTSLIGHFEQEDGVFYSNGGYKYGRGGYSTYHGGANYHDADGYYNGRQGAVTRNNGNQSGSCPMEQSQVEFLGGYE
jgi:hypothetical protein